MARSKHPAWRRIALLVAGWAMMVVAPITAPLPGPAATFIFAGGLALVLQNSAWARLRFVRLKRRWPKLGGWIDWAMRRRSAKRRAKRDAELTSRAPSPNGTGEAAAANAAFLHSETQDDYDEADFSAVEPGAGTPPRFPQPHGDPGRPQRDSRPAQSRPQQAVGVSTLTKRRDFLAANSGKRAPMPGFVLLVRDRQDGDPGIRVGFTVTKKIGNAVVRNRMKRRLRALSRELLPSAGLPGADHVLIGREGGIERDYSLLRAELTKALAKVQR